MKIFTLYDNGVPVAQQQVVGNDAFPCPAGWTDTTATPSIVPVPPVPATVSTPALRYVLSQQPAVKGGANLLADCDTYAAAAGGAAEIFWTRSATIDRTSTTLNALAASFGLTSAQVDALFVAAGLVNI